MLSDRQDRPLNLMFSGKWQPHDRPTTLKTLPDDDSASIRHWFDSTAARDHGAGRAEQFNQELATISCYPSMISRANHPYCSILRINDDARGYTRHNTRPHHTVSRFPRAQPLSRIQAPQMNHTQDSPAFPCAVSWTNPVTSAIQEGFVRITGIVLLQYPDLDDGALLVLVRWYYRGPLHSVPINHVPVRVHN